VLLLAVPGVASAQDQEDVDPLPEVATMVRELRYEDCLTAIRTVLAGQRSSPRTILRAVELRGIAHLGMGETSAAEEDFSHLLRLDPGVRLTDARPSPRVVQMFERAQSERSSTPPEDLVVAIAPPLIDGAAAAVVARPVGDSALARVVFYARDGSEQIAETDAEAGGPPWRADIEVEDRAQARRLHVRARGYAPSGELAAVSRESRVVDEDDADDGRLADDRRRRGPREPEEPAPIVERPWFLAIVGGVVVVGVVVVVLLLAGGDNREPDEVAGGGLR
jgi:hypothetical protein